MTIPTTDQTLSSSQNYNSLPTSINQSINQTSLLYLLFNSTSFQCHHQSINQTSSYQQVTKKYCTRVVVSRWWSERAAAPGRDCGAGEERRRHAQGSRVEVGGGARRGRRRLLGTAGKGRRREKAAVSGDGRRKGPVATLDGWWRVATVVGRGQGWAGGGAASRARAE